MDLQYKYFAFISYSHQDEKWGKWLHRSLESYKIPKKLIGTENSLGEEVPKKIFPVFRDRDELPVSSELSENINKALKQSKFLLVVCSPNSAKSKWVNEEIIQFKKLHGEDRILPIIVDGEPNADLKENWTGPEECFPPALKFHLNEKGEISEERTEPICGDARKGKDGKKNALLKLVAGILSIPYNVLKDREQQKRIRNLTLIGIVLGLLLLAFGWITWRAVEAEKGAKKALAANLVNKANLLIDENKKNEASAFLIKAMKLDENNIAYQYQLQDLWHKRSFFPANTFINHLNRGGWFIDLSEDGNLFLNIINGDIRLDETDKLKVWNLKNDSVIYDQEFSIWAKESVEFNSSNEVVVRDNYGYIHIFDLTKKIKASIYIEPKSVDKIYFSPNKK